MRLLAFETSTEGCSVALWLDGEVRERFEVAPRRHAELALPWAEALLADAGIARAQLDAVAVGRGPGAFTGVRLGVALAQGIALALDLPVLPVSTLRALAMRGMAEMFEGSRILAAIDARMGEIYAATFHVEGGEPQGQGNEVVIAPTDHVLPGEDDGWIGVGTGFAAGEGILQTKLAPRFSRIDSTALPHAADVARLAATAFARGEALPADKLEPAYLRNNVALTLAEQQAQRANKL
ncbi:tRNA (adenosine(37)-N6)-threonylcarbamoyltransferase complex dimerization subunit type 1 TsaB [Pseudoxanthomonas kalamensis DSM 18571]|uniref:tRNA (adenosine(37)-N6)-threonylcarbamoyltransferase complex dimerization subunit type 1 TsaB n=1 Tax=Pseudoxanthomonas kalamensis TaxID=289483 RepID=UPI0013912E23|nr:tRNA (adenosine(37)-N6)-threonylcarbamoyltransferase complex dimerization subunit type 1 TsaB [Pseudoxanthomonas kalamensis]KAF1709225.1 tRNA (adenosine(37)-N6)-threonylcarbamoyltransferase complex dimerization subunit type 1 TsaB [Pseudoxanthomonas kalamensis DSM 18571]